MIKAGLLLPFLSWSAAMLCACVACSLGEASLSCHAGPFKHDTSHTSRSRVASNSHWWSRLSHQICRDSHILIVYLRHYVGFNRALVVTSPTSLGAVRGGVARLPLVALGTVSGRILRVVTGIACLRTYLPKPDIWSSYMPALSSKLDDVLNLGAGLDFGLAVAPNISGFTYLSMSLCVVCLRCVMYLSYLSTHSVKCSTFASSVRIAFTISTRVPCVGVEGGPGKRDLSPGSSDVSKSTTRPS